MECCAMDILNCVDLYFKKLRSNQNLKFATSQTYM